MCSVKNSVSKAWLNFKAIYLIFYFLLKQKQTQSASSASKENNNNKCELIMNNKKNQINNYHDHIEKENGVLEEERCKGNDDDLDENEISQTNNNIQTGDVAKNEQLINAFSTSDILAAKKVTIKSINLRIKKKEDFN